MMKFFLGCLGLIAVPAVYSLHASCAQTQSFNLGGRWKVEFKFSGDEEHTLRFDAQSDVDVLPPLSRKPTIVGDSGSELRLRAACPQSTGRFSVHTGEQPLPSLKGHARPFV